MGQFCYWQVYKNIDFYLVIGITTIAFVILLYSIIYFIKICKYWTYTQKQTIFIYLFCILWAIFYISKNVFSSIAYAFDLKKRNQGSMFQYSQAFCVIDSIPTFFLQGLLIFIPFLWLKSISIFLQKLTRKQLKDKIINKFFQIYLVLRNIIYGALFILQLILPDMADPMCTSIISLIIFESLLSLILLSYGIVKLQNHFIPNSNEQEISKKTFKQNYLIIIGCSFIRFILDFYFIIYQQIQEDDLKNCFTYRNDDYAFTSVYLVFGSILMHLLPISMILKINQIDFKQLEYKRMNQNQ